MTNNIIMTSNAKDVSTYFRKLGPKLKKAWYRGLRNSVRDGKSIALQLAPQKSGTLKAGIFYRLFKNKAMLVSSVPGDFPYNKWINMDEPYIGLNFPKGAWIPPSKSYTGRWARILPPGGIALYGIAPNWNWTGVPKFMDIAGAIMEIQIQRNFTPEITKAIQTG